VPSPSTDIAVLESAKRTDEPGNSLLVQQIAGSSTVLVTVKPGFVEAVEHALRDFTSFEICSPLGRGELCRALELVEESPPGLDLYGFRYIATSIDNFCPAQTVHKTPRSGRRINHPHNAN